MNSVYILREFKENIITFLDELIEVCPQESNFILARILINDRIPIADVMITFIKEVLPLKKVIDTRDESFFLDNNITLFKGADQSTVNHFKTLWKSSLLDEDDKRVIWEWFDSFIVIATQYQKVRMEEVWKLNNSDRGDD